VQEEEKEDGGASNEALLRRIGVLRSDRCMSSTNSPKLILFRRNLSDKLRA